MRLLNTKTLQVESLEEGSEKYAILSHTWGNDEVLYRDIQDPTRMEEIRKRNGAGYRKIAQSCEKALSRGHDYIWIDTCCIDKSSSAELSEAINSMFRWYTKASACYAYLSDVFLHEVGVEVVDGLKKSRWFTRGWTLQELIAPNDVEFFDHNWSPLGDRHTLASTIREITGIDQSYLHRPDAKKDRKISTQLQRENVATRMGWMAQRETTRVEDMAYSMLGIFGINMPILYGEGNRAFLRLQEEILKQSQDQSILVWRWPLSRKPEEKAHRMHFLADSPANFNLRTYAGQEDSGLFGIRLTDQGLVLRVWKCPCKLTRWNHDKTELIDAGNRWLAVLDCSLSPDTLSRPAIILGESPYAEGVFRREPTSVIMVIEHDQLKSGYLDTGGDRNAIHSIEYKPEFKTETILLESDSVEPESRLRGSFPFKVNMILKERELKQRAAYTGSQRYIVAGQLANKPTQNPIYGVIFLGDDETNTELVVWWGLIEEGTAMYDVHNRHNGPRVWSNSVPVCFAQSWKNLTGSETWDGSLAESLAVNMLCEEFPLPWKGTERPSVVEVQDGLDLQNVMNESKPMATETVIELFTQCAQPVIECVGWGMRLKASMKRVEFLGRLCCELDIEEKNPNVEIP
ncbi:heterokaryon incompatibility protein-domain-containing protein [Fusarium tricinctum]|uniref:Heterokaryon incompatibility protein-domain-containing protein n=2 Tax=Fusarium tricinctum species complex TaxID=679429 RepID=A0A8K0W6R7_9HYPO|nr:heterokaryon incompatibility protein-domain-containing protein [Fusarium tricinctum]